MFKIQIPKPCHADWYEMTPTKQGAFCGSCSKEVVDFTRMNDEEVKNYFLHKSTGNTCGRFKTEQIHRIRIQLPDNIFIQKMAGWKKYMAVVLLSFGSMLFGCDVDVNKKTTGKIASPTIENSQTTGDTIAVDSIQTLGEAMPEMGKPIIIKKDESCNIMTGAVAVPIDYQIMGDIAVEPDSIQHRIIDTAVRMKMGEIATPEPVKKKPASDTGKCKDPGYY